MNTPSEQQASGRLRQWVFIGVVCLTADFIGVTLMFSFKSPIPLVLWFLGVAWYVFHLTKQKLLNCGMKARIGMAVLIAIFLVIVFPLLLIVLFMGEGHQG